MPRSASTPRRQSAAFEFHGLSLLGACREFDVDRLTLQRRLHAAWVKLEQGGKLTILEVHKALMESNRASGADEKTRLAKEQADRIALENAATRGETMTADFVYAKMEPFAVAVRRIIVASALSDHDKEQILAQLRRVASGEILGRKRMA